jgi:hypothetical protein
MILADGILSGQYMLAGRLDHPAAEVERRLGVGILRAGAFRPAALVEKTRLDVSAEVLILAHLGALDVLNRH